MSDDSGELVQRCLAGDEEALREFVARFQQRVFALCLKMLRHRQDAEDAAQESLVRAVRYLSSWDSSRPLAPWVLMIAANRCRSALAARARRPVPARSLPDTVEPAETGRTDLREELEQAFGTLKEKQRTCFLLYYQQELSVSEVAEAMDVPEGTVKTWLHRSRNELAAMLANRGVTPESEHELRRISKTAGTSRRVVSDGS